MTDSVITPVPVWRDRPARTYAINEARRAVAAARQQLLALLRDEVLWRDGPVCHYCGIETMRQPADPPADWNHDWDRTVDHKVPVDRGGRDDVDNLVICCRRCNSEKGTQPYDIFLARRRPLRIHVPTDERYEQSQRVRHAVFGEGIVVVASDAEVVVAFGNGGRIAGRLLK